MDTVSEIKLIRTDTTLDLSQKAEKVCAPMCASGLNIFRAISQLHAWSLESKSTPRGFRQTATHGSAPESFGLYLGPLPLFLQPVTFKAQGFKSRGEPRGFRSIHRPKCFGLACSGRLEQLKKHKEWHTPSTRMRADKKKNLLYMPRDLRCTPRISIQSS